MTCFWISLWITLVLVLLVIEIKNTKAKIIIANLCAIPLAILAAEGVCGILSFEQLNNSNSYMENTPEYYQAINYLGYGPSKNFKDTAIKKVNNKVIYKVNYTINSDGLRETLSSNDKSDKCLMFFGDSFTFGEGLNDNETLPYLVGEKANGKYKIYNFGFSGYGPHQMLSAIEHGITDKIIKGCKESTAIYIGQDDHIPRIAGKKSWDKHGPKYLLVNAEAVYQGHFDEGKKNLSPKIESLLEKSKMYKNLNNYINEQKSNVNDKEKEYYRKLYIAILKKSQKLLKEKYNTKNFIVIFWNNFDKESTVNIKQLSFNSFEYYLQNDILPICTINCKMYQIKGDRHPNKLANEYIADFLIKKLNQKNRS